MDDGIILRDERKFFISRIPKQTKEEIIAFANEEFCEDYGLCIKYIWDTFKIWKTFFENMDYKLNHIIEILSQEEKKPDKDEITLLSGRKVKGGKNKENVKN